SRRASIRNQKTNNAANHAPNHGNRNDSHWKLLKSLSLSRKNPNGRYYGSNGSPPPGISCMSICVCFPCSPYSFLLQLLLDYLLINSVPPGSLPGLKEISIDQVQLHPRHTNLPGLYMPYRWLTTDNYSIPTGTTLNR